MSPIEELRDPAVYQAWREQSIICFNEYVLPQISINPDITTTQLITQVSDWQNLQQENHPGVDCYFPLSYLFGAATVTERQLKQNSNNPNSAHELLLIQKAKALINEILVPTLASNQT